MNNVRIGKEIVAKKKNLLHRILGCWQLYLLLIPAAVAVIIFSYTPMYGIQLAFKDLLLNKGITGSPWVGLKHFIRFFGMPNCWTLIWNTFKVALCTILTFPCSIIFALMLNEMRNTRARKIMQNISYIPYLFSVVIVISVVNVFLAPKTGVVNILIEKLGGEPILFFGHPKYVLPIYVISGLWQSLGYNAIIYVAALSNIDQEQLEAARIDGAGRWKVIWYIELPTLADTIIIMLILSCGSMFAVGPDKMLLLQTSLNMDASEILSTYVYKIGLLGGQFGFSTAVSLFNTLVNLTFLLLVNGIMKKFSGNSVY